MTRNSVSPVGAGPSRPAQATDVQIGFLNSVFLIAAVAAFGMGFVRWETSAIMGTIDFVYAGISFILLAWLKRHPERVATVATIALIVSSILCFAIYLLAPYNTVRLSLFFLLGAAAFFLEGRRAGRNWFAVIVASIVGTHWLAPLRTAYSDVDILTTCISLLALLLILESYETFKDRQHQGESEREILPLSQQMLKENAVRLNEAQRIAGMGSWTLDHASGKLDWSQQTHRLFETDPEHFDATYAAFLARVHPADRALLDRTFRESLSAHAPHEFEHRLLMPDGRIKWVHERCESRFDGEGRLLSSVGTMLDITVRKQAEVALQENRDLLAAVTGTARDAIILLDDAGAVRFWNAAAEQLFGYPAGEIMGRGLSQFVVPERFRGAHQAGFAHFIKSGEGHAIGLTHLMRRAGATPEQAERIARIDGAGRHLLAIIDDILHLSKIESDPPQAEGADFHLAAILDEVRSLIGEQAAAKGLAVDVDSDGVPPWLHGNPAGLRRALLKYAENAVKFTEHGTISLRTMLLEKTGDQFLVRFEVRDTGAGIAPDRIPQLFQAFEQADPSTTRKFGGLGLAIVRSLASLMGGEVGVDSTPGVGSRFWFTARLGRGRGVMPAAMPAGGTNADQAQLAAVLVQLEALLAMGDIAAGDLARQEAGLLRAALGPAAEDIQHRIAVFDHQGALEALRASEPRRAI